MTLRQTCDRIAYAVTLVGLLGLVIVTIIAAATGNFSGQSYSSGTYCSGCGPKWSR